MATKTGLPRQRRRADAERSIAAIVDAAVSAFGERPDPTLSDIAQAAGVGRVTLYAHFPTRNALLEAAVDKAVGEGVAALDAARVDDGPARDALDRLIRVAWPILDRHRGLFRSASTLSPSRLRDRHEAYLGRIHRLIERGQADGSFRTDVPADWLVSICYSLTHAAAQEVNDGRLSPSEAARVLELTLNGAVAPPPAAVSNSRSGEEPTKRAGP